MCQRAQTSFTECWVLGPHKPLLQNHPGLRVLRAHSRNPLYQEGHWKRTLSPGKPKDKRNTLLLEHVAAIELDRPCNRLPSSLQPRWRWRQSAGNAHKLSRPCAVIAPIGQTKPHQHKLLSADLCFRNLHFSSPLLRLLWLKTTSFINDRCIDRLAGSEDMYL